MEPILLGETFYGSTPNGTSGTKTITRYEPTQEGSVGSIVPHPP